MVVVYRPDGVIVAGDLPIAVKKENVWLFGVSRVEACAKLHPFLNRYEEINGTLGHSLYVILPGVKQVLQYLRLIQRRYIAT